MKFGEWVQNTRKDQDQDIRSLAEKTGVDVGTISRIENVHTQATIYTVFRLAEGLNTSLPDLIQALSGKYLSSFEEKKLASDANVLTLLDVEKIVEDFNKESLAVRSYLAKCLNDLEQGLSSISLEASKEKRLVSFDVEDIDKLLYPSQIYRVDMVYPRMLKSEIIQFTYERNGVLIASDIQTYTRGKTTTLKMNEQLTRGSTNVFLRLTEPSSMDRIRFNELVSLDEELGEEGRLLGIFWEVCRFNEKFSPSLQRVRYHDQPTLFEIEHIKETALSSRKPEEYRLARFYIIIYRWYQFLNRSKEVVRFEKY